MKAILVNEDRSLRWDNVPDPVIKPDEVLVKIEAAALNRAAEPQEIIDLCLYLASDKGHFINGENIMIDGGRNAMGRKI